MLCYAFVSSWCWGIRPGGGQGLLQALHPTSGDAQDGGDDHMVCQGSTQGSPRAEPVHTQLERVSSHSPAQPPFFFPYLASGSPQEVGAPKPARAPLLARRGAPERTSRERRC